MSIKLFDVKWKMNTAGPSPYNNERTEVFFFGCNRAVQGNPCKGCFNSKLWDSSVAIYTHEPKEIADQIARYSPNRYVTIGGGEPTDQMDDLIELCSELKKKGFHIMVYTWKNLDSIFNGLFPQSVIMQAQYEKEVLTPWNNLFEVVDMIIDGEYHEEERLYDDNGSDGTFNSIGSGNQVVWNVKPFNEQERWSDFKQRNIEGYALRDVLQLAINEKNQNLVYLLKDNVKPLQLRLW